jgi:hypothetical protein
MNIFYCLYLYLILKREPFLPKKNSSVALLIRKQPGLPAPSGVCEKTTLTSIRTDGDSYSYKDGPRPYTRGGAPPAAQTSGSPAHTGGQPAARHALARVERSEHPSHGLLQRAREHQSYRGVLGRQWRATEQRNHGGGADAL